MSNHPKVPWSVWDKFLLIVLSLVAVLVVGIGTWLHALDTNPTISVPTPAMPTNNAYTYDKAAADAVVDSGKIEYAIQRHPAVQAKPVPATNAYPGSGLSASPYDRSYSLGEKKKIVAENAPALKLLHTGFRYPYQSPPRRSFNAVFPGYQKIRALARLLSLQAQVDSQKDDWNGAIQADLDSIQLGETMAHGGSLIGMLVGQACEAIGRRRAWEIVPHLNTIQALAAAQRLESIRAGHVPTAAVLQEEKWAIQASLMELMTQKGWPSSYVNLMNSQQPNNGNSTPQWGQWLFGTRIRFTGKRAIMTNYTHYMDQSIADARQPYAAHPQKPSIPDDPLNQMILPVFDSLRLDEVKSHTQNGLLLVVLALQAYHTTHRAYPATLSILVPQYLPSVPDDPFALSGPLRYKLLRNNYVLYSVGPDSKDDGGKAIFDHSLPAPTTADALDRRREIQENSTGDILAGVNIS